jgi:hypothetical protein
MTAIKLLKYRLELFGVVERSMPLKDRVAMYDIFIRQWLEIAQKEGKNGL